MKLSEKPTAFLLLKAYTGSEWDSCEFAIVRITEDWKKQQAKRLEAVKPFAGDYNFISLNYYDTSVNFYKTDGDEHPGIEQCLGGNEWVFVELDDNEEDSFEVPESRLDCHKLVVYKDGYAMFKAYGKNTSDEFWTEGFLLHQLIQ
jgi:hypothetical protein